MRARLVRATPPPSPAVVSDPADALEDSPPDCATGAGPISGGIPRKFSCSLRTWAQSCVAPGPMHRHVGLCVHVLVIVASAGVDDDRTANEFALCNQRYDTERDGNVSDSKQQSIAIDSPLDADAPDDASTVCTSEDAHLDLDHGYWTPVDEPGTVTDYDDEDPSDDDLSSSASDDDNDVAGDSSLCQSQPQTQSEMPKLGRNVFGTSRATGPSPDSGPSLQSWRRGGAYPTPQPDRCQRTTTPVDQASDRGIGTFLPSPVPSPSRTLFHQRRPRLQTHAGFLLSPTPSTSTGKSVALGASSGEITGSWVPHESLFESTVTTSRSEEQNPFLITVPAPKHEYAQVPTPLTISRQDVSSPRDGCIPGFVVPADVTPRANSGAKIMVPRFNAGDETNVTVSQSIEQAGKNVLGTELRSKTAGRPPALDQSLLATDGGFQSSGFEDGLIPQVTSALEDIEYVPAPLSSAPERSHGLGAPDDLGRHATAAGGRPDSQAPISTKALGEAALIAESSSESSSSGSRPQTVAKPSTVPPMVLVIGLMLLSIPAIELTTRKRTVNPRPSKLGTHWPIAMAALPLAYVVGRYIGKRYRSVTPPMLLGDADVAWRHTFPKQAAAGFMEYCVAGVILLIGTVAVRCLATRLTSSPWLPGVPFYPDHVTFIN